MNTKKDGRKIGISLGLGMLICLSLSGCTGTASRFHCNEIYPDRCLSLDASNQMAIEQSEKNASKLLAPTKTFYAYPNTSEITPPHYQGEKVQTVWLAPYRDAHNNYHAASTVFAVVKRGHWSSDVPRKNQGAS